MPRPSMPLHLERDPTLTYPIDVQSRAGDVIETTCVWHNDGDEYVLPGLYTEDEMCTHAVTGVPAEAAYCEPEP